MRTFLSQKTCHFYTALKSLIELLLPRSAHDVKLKKDLPVLKICRFYTTLTFLTDPVVTVISARLEIIRTSRNNTVHEWTSSVKTGVNYWSYSFTGLFNMIFWLDNCRVSKELPILLVSIVIITGIVAVTGHDNICLFLCPFLADIDRNL